jgi:hypothetical protein
MFVFILYVLVETLNAHAAATFTMDARSFSIIIQYRKLPESRRSLYGNVVLHVVELFSPLPLRCLCDLVVLVRPKIYVTDLKSLL